MGWIKINVTRKLRKKQWRFGHSLFCLRKGDLKSGERKKGK